MVVFSFTYLRFLSSVNFELIRFLVSDPNQGPFPVPVEWTTFNPSLQNYLHEAPTYSIKSFDAEKIANYNFCNDLLKHAQYPPDIIFPPPSGVDIKPEGYFFKDLKNRYVLTERGRGAIFISSLSLALRVYQIFMSCLVQIKFFLGRNIYLNNC